MSQPEAGAPTERASGEPAVAGASIDAEAERAFERGDWHQARAIARRDLASSNEAQRGAARAFLGRLAPDRQLMVVYAIALSLFAAVAWSYLRG